VIKSWFRRALRRCRIDVPFTDVVCPQHVKTIRVHNDARIEVIDRRSLVFLDLPESDDLRDVVPIAPEGESVPYLSPDAIELHRTSTRKGTQVCWIPRQPIVPYALYVHQHGWVWPGQPADAVLYNEFRCEMRTGAVDLEIVTPRRFEAGVAFKRPRWRRLSTERSLIKYALSQLESGGEPPTIADDGARVEWKLLGPKLGDRYLYVAFEEHGVELWRKRLEPKSLAARMRRLITKPLASA
jgi:hypothetical protein